MSGVVAAVDLGATSGRVMLSHVSHDELSIRPVARFANTPVRTPDGLHWNILELYRNVLSGLGSAVHAAPELTSIGVDSWAVDYALMRGGRMLGTPYHYRDERTAAGVERVHTVVSPQELYTRNGLQHLPFNTVFQLATEELEQAETVLLIPDLIGHWLSGETVTEVTNASTTGLLGAHSREWDDELIARLGLPRGLLPRLVQPGDTIGELLPYVRDELGIADAARSIRLTAVGSHDTASAVVAVPATDENFAYISCGTWGLVGLELEHPVLSEEARAASFTNEAGVDGRVRFLHNVMGLWLLNESLHSWERAGLAVELPGLLRGAARVTAPVIDVNDPRFMAPGDMPSRIADYCREHGLPVPSSPEQFVRCILESLAEAFATTVHTAAELAGRRVDVIHLVGGGAQNELLCRLVAERSGLRVLAGPVEATAIGNALVQARAAGIIDGSLEAMRRLVSLTTARASYSHRP